jgi:hypothetical protein
MEWNEMDLIPYMKKNIKCNPPRMQKNNVTA